LPVSCGNCAREGSVQGFGGAEKLDHASRRAPPSVDERCVPVATPAFRGRSGATMDREHGPRQATEQRARAWRGRWCDPRIGSELRWSCGDSGGARIREARVLRTWPSLDAEQAHARDNERETIAERPIASEPAVDR